MEKIQEKVTLVEGRKWTNDLGNKYFSNAKIIDQLDGIFVIEENGNFFTVEIKAHAIKGECSTPVLERIQYRRKEREEKRKAYEAKMRGNS